MNGRTRSVTSPATVNESQSNPDDEPTGDDGGTAGVPGDAGADAADDAPGTVPAAVLTGLLNGDFARLQSLAGDFIAGEVPDRGVCWGGGWFVDRGVVCGDGEETDVGCAPQPTP